MSYNDFESFFNERCNTTPNYKGTRTTTAEHLKKQLSPQTLHKRYWISLLKTEIKILFWMREGTTLITLSSMDWFFLYKVTA